MSKTAREVIAEQMIGPSPGFLIGDAEADGILISLYAAGFVIVPKEPTETMLAAGAEHKIEEQKTGLFAYLTDADAQTIYRAMIEAASK